MIRYKIRFTPEAAGLLTKLHPDNKKMIKKELKILQKNPDTGGDLQEELSGFKTCRIKRYRIIYKINEEQKEIQIFHIGHRSDVYEQFQILLNRIKA